MSDKRVITPEEVLAALEEDHGTKGIRQTTPRSKGDIQELIITLLDIPIDRKRVYSQSVASQLAETVNVASISRSLTTLVDAGKVTALDMELTRRIGMSTWYMRDNATYYVLTNRFNEAVKEAEDKDRNKLYETLSREAELHILMIHKSEVEAEYKRRCEAHGLDTSVEPITQGEM